MSTRLEVPVLAPLVTARLSGAGGQGLILMGKLLAEAAALYEGLNVIQTKSYGPEARGGACRSDVLISPGEIDDLAGLPLDILVCLSQASCDRFFGELAPQGLLIVDSTLVTVVPTSRAVELPLTATAANACGSKMVANVVALGAVCGYSQVVQLASLQAAVKASVKASYHELNLKALQAGYDLALAHQKERPRGAAGREWDFSYLRQPPTAKVRPVRAAKPKAKVATARRRAS
jgi:2-oxoglutarate ferredoxin oxidoreductase subunit gamma